MSNNPIANDIRRKLVEEHHDEGFDKMCSPRTPEVIAAHIAAERIRFNAWEKAQMKSDNQGFTLFDIWLGALEGR